MHATYGIDTHLGSSLAMCWWISAIFLLDLAPHLICIIQWEVYITMWDTESHWIKNELTLSLLSTWKQNINAPCKQKDNVIYPKLSTYHSTTYTYIICIAITPCITEGWITYFTLSWSSWHLYYVYSKLCCYHGSLYLQWVEDGEEPCKHKCVLIHCK